LNAALLILRLLERTFFDLQPEENVYICPFILCIFLLRLLPNPLYYLLMQPLIPYQTLVYDIYFWIL